MTYSDRKELYRVIEKDRATKVLSFITSDRIGMEDVNCSGLHRSILLTFSKK